MYNNTLTSSEKYYTSSSISLNEISSVKELSEEYKSNDISFGFNYLYSIELKRTSIKNNLCKHFEFESHHNELDFLASNTKILELLPGIAEYIKNSFDINSRLVLELMSENKYWQTLFINIHTKKSWEISSKFIDELLENLFDSESDIAQNLNLNIVPDEF